MGRLKYLVYGLFPGNLIHDHRLVDLKLIHGNFIGRQENIRIAMARIAALILGGIALDVMRRGIRPGRQFVEIRQQVVSVISKIIWRFCRCRTVT